MLVDFTFDVTLDTGDYAGETFTGTFTLDGFTGSGMEEFRPEGSVSGATGTIRAFDILGMEAGDDDRYPDYPLISAYDGDITVMSYAGNPWGDTDKRCKFGCIDIEFSPQENNVWISSGCCGFDLPQGHGTITNIAVVPLPPSIALLSLGLAGMGITLRRKV
jgi:hypothetical protein